MSNLKNESQFETFSSLNTYDFEDYQRGVPRWCKGCGDMSLLTAVQQMLQDHQVSPESVTCVSGIGCSSRFPHYLNTYGFHGIHGRALTVATGIELTRPDLKVITVMGDGDCFSIGGNHWLHAIRHNINSLVIVLDNEVYALTKKQVSPTSPSGMITNTSPRGSYLESLNPLSVVLGVTNVSFVAQTATWLPGHLENTIKKAWQHNGLAFVRILQRCPVHVPKGFGDNGESYPTLFLRHESGIEVDKGFLDEAPEVDHDQWDINEAQRVATNRSQNPMGLIYQNTQIPSYGEMRRKKIEPIDRKSLIKKINESLDSYSV